jgi:sec-independent protein translocase protein TatB
MFDIGFWELAIIGVVALLVIGPERLPRVARTAGLWLGRARRFVATVKADIDREIAADELKKTLAKQAEVPELYDIVEDTKQSIQQTQQPAVEQQPPSENGTVTKKSNDTGG